MVFCRFLGLVALAVLVWDLLGFSGEAAEEKPPVQVAQIRLAGSLDENPPQEDALFGLSGENFRAKLERIKKAKQDKNIKALVLQIDQPEAGWGKIEELRRAITDFRTSGKKVYAHLEMGTTKDYLIGLACDEVLMPESGWLMLTGMEVEVSFYKDLLDKIGVQADMLQMGEFKGAAEPFTRSGMSPQLRQQLAKVLDDRFEEDLVKAIARARIRPGWDIAKVKKLIDEGPYSARAAAAVGLIDRVTYFTSLDQVLKTDLKAAQVKIVKDYQKAKAKELDFSNPFDLFKLFTSSKPATSKKPKVAVIYATGVIVTGKSSQGGLLGDEVCGSTTLVEAIRQAETDNTVKAIVLRVDSPGGSALASDLIWNELKRCQKPVLASMSDVAASGGYYISMAARKIFAEPGTLTGSIGVVGGKLVLGGLENKIGLRTEILRRGANAGLFSTETPFSESERKVFLALMKDTYEQFLSKTLHGRQKAGVSMSRAQLESLAGGRIWTGRQAKANGLVDELGTLQEAIAGARKMAAVPEGTDLEILQLPRPRPFLETLLETQADAELRWWQSLGRPLPGMKGKLRGLQGVLQLRSEPVWLLMPALVEVR